LKIAKFVRVRLLMRLKRVLDAWCLRSCARLGESGYEAVANKSVTDARTFVVSTSRSVQQTIGEVAVGHGHWVDYDTDSSHLAMALSVRPDSGQLRLPWP